jgi:hypothetical protein
VCSCRSTMNDHPATVLPRAARSSDFKSLDALLVSLTAITGVLMLTLVLLALFSRHPSLELLKMLAFLAVTFGGISLALSRAMLQAAHNAKKPTAPRSRAIARPAARPFVDRRRIVDRRRSPSRLARRTTGLRH